IYSMARSDDENPPPPPLTQQAPHIVSTIKLPILKKGVSTEDANQKFLRSLPSSWSQVSLVMRTKPEVDSLSLNCSQNSCDFTTVTINGESEERRTTEGIIRNYYDHEDGETTPRFEE
ncbi:hypothetical protein Tco_0999254, partial [Tanacetum coccineum]